MDRQDSRSREYVVELGPLLHIKNEIEDAGRDTQTEKVQQFVVEWEYMDEVREAEECEREHDQDRKCDKPLVRGNEGIGQIGTQQVRGKAHRSDAQGQIVLWDVEGVRTHDGLEGTTTMAACIAH